MFIEPGIMEHATHAGIKKIAMTDLNHDGRIDSTDLNMARTNIQTPVLDKICKSS